MDVDAAYAQCLRDARGHYENFPVASMLVPAQMRPHIAALYAFARAADDFADEGDRSTAQRRVLLESWRARLHEAAGPKVSQRPLVAGEPPHTEAIFLALGASITRLQLPVSLFEDLLSAFEQDTRIVRYETWQDLLDYCRRSANPVGRLVLRIAGQVDSRLDDWSDSICTALQLTNFWQDFAQDLARGRLYLPREASRARNASEADLGTGITPAWTHAVEDAVLRTRQMFEHGRPLASALRGRLRYEIRGTWLGGMRVLEKIERAGFDVLSARPRLGRGDVAWIAVRLLT